MSWWWRVVLTVVLGPPIWWIIAGYVATQQGADIAQWVGDIPSILPQLYLSYTLPALLLCAILYGIDQLLKLMSLDLFSVLVSPLAAYLIAWLAVTFIAEPHVQAARSALPLLACYGLVWGLTIREPRRRRTTIEGDSIVA